MDTMDNGIEKLRDPEINIALLRLTKGNFYPQTRPEARLIEARKSISSKNPLDTESNRQINQTVQTVNLMLKKALCAGTDPYSALLHLCHAPVTGLASVPSQLLMGWLPRSTLPAVTPRVPTCAHYQ